VRDRPTPRKPPKPLLVHTTRCAHWQCEADHSHKIILPLSLSIDSSCNARTARGCTITAAVCVSAVAMPSRGHRRTCRGAAGRDALPSRSLLRSCTNSSDELQLWYTGLRATCPPSTIALPAPAAATSGSLRQQVKRSEVIAQVPQQVVKSPSDRSIRFCIHTLAGGWWHSLTCAVCQPECCSLVCPQPMQNHVHGACVLTCLANVLHAKQKLWHRIERSRILVETLMYMQ
jgi:hypothetical protein